MNTTTLHTDGFYFDQVSYQTVVKDGKLMHLEIHNLADRDGNKKQVAYDRLPAIRSQMTEKGFDDFCFGPNMQFGGNWHARKLVGVPYKDCDDAEAIWFELTHGCYRSLEAREVLRDLVFNKFHYHEWVTTSKYDNYIPTVDIISDSEYKSRLKAQAKREQIIQTLMAGGEIVIRHSRPIDKIKGGDMKGWYNTGYCTTCRDFRGVYVDLYFDPSTEMSTYKNDKDSYHIVKDGKPIKTRTHHCLIKGKPMIDEKMMGEYDRLDIIVESIRLAEE